MIFAQPKIDSAKFMSLQIAELFAGIGGVASGFCETGYYEPIFLHDANPLARRAFVHNFPEHDEVYQLGQVEKLTGPAVLDFAGGHVDGILGCPPCQGLSAAGLRDDGDERNQLLFDMHRIVWSADPDFFILENVPSLLGTDLFRSFEESISSRYILASGVLNAAEFGAPQLRRRAIVIGFRSKIGVTPSLPTPTHGGIGKVFNYVAGRIEDVADRETRSDLGLSMGEELPSVSLTNLHSAFADLPPADVEGGTVEYVSPPTTTYQNRMRRNADLEVRDHKAWRHRAETRKRLDAVSPGDCPRSQGSRGRNTTYFSQAYSRLHPEGLARTVTTNFHNPGSGRFTHYADPRTITVREALRLQGFADDFTFPDDVSQTDAETMVGNAFPVPLATALGNHVNQLLS